MKDVVEETIVLVPKLNPFFTPMIHGMRDVDEMLEELRGDVLVNGILPSQLQRNRQHIQAVHAHPSRAVRLLDMTACGERRAAIEDADIVQPEKPTLENILAFGVLA